MQEPKVNPKRTALVLILMQNDVITGRVRASGVIENAAKAAWGMRQTGCPIIHVKGVIRPELDGARAQRITDTALAASSPRARRILVEGTVGAEIVDELKPMPEDYVMVTYGESAFQGTPLQIVLRRLGMDTLVVGGFSTRMSVESTVRDATDRDFNVIVLSDCCASLDQESHDYPIHKIFPLLARVRTTDQVLNLITN